MSENDFFQQLEQNDQQKRRIKKLQTIRLRCFKELCSGLSHELNNPLFLIKGFNERVQKRLRKRCPESYEALKEYFQVIEDGIFRIEKITEAMRQFSEPSDEAPKPFSINELLQKCLTLCSAQGGSVKVLKNFDPKNPSIQAEEKRIEQALVQLIRNAFEAVEESEEKVVILSSKVKKNRVSLKIQDSGCGISKENKILIFNPFFTTKKVKAGLGLSISKEIIKEQKGQISVSSSPEKGACFSLCFPLAS